MMNKRILKPSEIKIGQRYYSKLNSKTFLRLTVMAIADNYIMARYKGCVPFVKHINGFLSLVNNDTKKK